jgi:hypothetical protein
VDQLFNSSEKRLARMLLLLANFGKEGKPELVIPSISQETLAGLVGTNRQARSSQLNAECRPPRLKCFVFLSLIRVHFSNVDYITRKL